MTNWRLAIAGLSHYRRTHAAVAAGVAAAVAVLAGALLVGSSVRASLVGLTTARLGRTALVVGAERPFTVGLRDRFLAQPGMREQIADAAALFAARGFAERESADVRASGVDVYGIDDRFFAFHGVSVTAPGSGEVLLSADLAAELGASSGDIVLVRVARPTDIPIDSLHGRKDDTGRSIRLRVRDVLSADAMGEFSLAPAQGPVRAAFVSLARLQRDLAQAGRATAMLVSATPGQAPTAEQVSTALRTAVEAADLGLTVEPSPVPGTVIVEVSTGLVPETIQTAVSEVAARHGLTVTPAFTWLANSMAIGDRLVPYSLVTAIGAEAGGDEAIARALAAPGASPPPIVLNEWAAQDLQAKIGDDVTMTFYRWADEGRLVTDRSPFRVAAVVPMKGLAADRRLAPDYPGISESPSVADWDPPFPVDLKLIRPRDESYWNQFRTTPKAFIPLEVGQQLWRTRHGDLTSLRLTARDPGAAVDTAAIAARVRDEVTRAIDPARAGLQVVDVRRQNLQAAVGATDFGAYFSYFSFFLVVSALILAALCFRLSVEQRFREVGVLRAMGLSIAAVRRVFLMEGGLIAAAGALIGVVLAIGWAALMMYGLRTWWVGAVGTTRLRLHLDPVAMAIGAGMGLLAAIVSIALSVRSLRHATPRELITGAGRAGDTSRRSRASIVAVTCFALAVIFSATSFAGLMPAAGGFFGAGALALIGGLAVFKAWLGRRRTSNLDRAGIGGVVRLGLHNASWRPGRSMTAAALVAAAAFLLVSVDSFRKGADDATGPQSGTGGFSLMGEAALPIVHDPSTPEGRVALGLTASASDTSLAGVEVMAARLRPGEDASCLNLYQPSQPRVLGVSQAFIDAGRFRFARSLATTDADRANPWRLLGPPDAEGIVPAILDATSLQYIFHAAVGDVLTIDAETSRPIRLRIVASLNDSVLQGEVMVGEQAFATLFPDEAGYRVLLVGVTPTSAPRVADVSRLLESGLEAYGFDAQETTRRLEAYHRVENTYLSTFQSLGGLGLMLGVFGLSAVIARNVLERRRELALLGAAGYSRGRLQALVLAEHLALVVVGLLVGTSAAAIAIVPVILERGGRASGLPIVWLLAVFVAGLVASVLATRRVRRLPLVASLRSE